MDFILWLCYIIAVSVFFGNLWNIVDIISKEMWKRYERKADRNAS